MTGIIDTHCHYNLSPLLENWQAHWQKAQAQGVKQSIIVGTNGESLHKALEIASAEGALLCAAGIHPTNISLEDIHQADQLIQGESQLLVSALQSQSEKIIAIGETGLDYYRLDQHTTDSDKVITAQKKLFDFQLKLAQEYQLPIVLHIRDKTTQAYDEAFEMLNSYDLPQIILHCFSGPGEFLEKMVSRGAFFGVDGHITYPNNTEMREQLTRLPNHKILLETDAPFLPPVHHRGKVCEPWMIRLTADYLQTQLRLDQAQITENARAAFPGLK